MISAVLAVTESDKGWDTFLQFTEKERNRDWVKGAPRFTPIQSPVSFPRIELKENELILENTVKSFGSIPVVGFVRLQPKLPEGVQSSALRIDKNSNYRKWFTGRQEEKINHHIPEESEELRYVVIDGKYERQGDPRLFDEVNLLFRTPNRTPEQDQLLEDAKKRLSVSRGEKLPLETSYEKLYVFRKGQWIPKVVLDYLAKEKKEEAREQGIAHLTNFHGEIGQAIKNPEALTKVFEKYTVKMEEGTDPKCRLLKKKLNESQPVVRIVEIPVGKGATTMNYSPTTYKPKHYQTPGTSGKRTWNKIVQGMQKVSGLTELQELVARKYNLLGAV